eukprot:823967-Rhodomonas_salina.4
MPAKLTSSITLGPGASPMLAPGTTYRQQLPVPSVWQPASSPHHLRYDAVRPRPPAPSGHSVQEPDSSRTDISTSNLGQ